MKILFLGDVMGRAARSYIIRPSLLEGGHYNERRNNARPRPAHKGSAPHFCGSQHHISNTCQGLASTPSFPLLSRDEALARGALPLGGVGEPGRRPPQKQTKSRVLRGLGSTAAVFIPTTVCGQVHFTFVR